MGQELNITIMMKVNAEESHFFAFV
uniref:Uncharacterized protein n=1 Tax=Arundo donax TaxID=35708 RepID=A0A0A9AEQ1_ARUDO